MYECLKLQAAGGRTACGVPSAEPGYGPGSVVGSSWRTVLDTSVLNFTMHLGVTEVPTSLFFYSLGAAKP